MEDGNFVYYTLQHRRTHETTWAKPDGPLEPVDNDWGFSSFDSFGHVFDPWAQYGVKKYQNSSDEIHAVWANTGMKGWWSLKYAVAALKALRKASEAGVLDDMEYGSGHLNRRVRYEFQIVKMTVAQKTEVVSIGDLFDALEKEVA